MDVSEFDEVGVGGGSDYEDKTIKRSLFKNLNGATGYLISDARQAFTQLRQVFSKALILQHFDLECHIRIETDVTSYGISKFLSQLTLNNLG